jgi:hypothetical protein
MKVINTKENEMGGACSMYELDNTFIFSLVRKHELKRPLRKP